MKPLDTLLQEFEIDIVDIFQEIDALPVGYDFSNESKKILTLLTKAYHLGEVIGAEKHAKLIEVKTPMKEAYNMPLLKLEGYNEALKIKQELSQKALEQIKQELV